ncbi:MAG: DUF6125 family protein [Desulfobacterales bacterium]
MKPLRQIKTEEQIELLKKCWMTHDGMWFYHCLQELGIEKTNMLNKAAIKSLAPIETGRMIRAMGIEGKHIQTFAEFKNFFENAAALFIGDFMNIRMSFPAKNVLHWEFEPQNCFAYKGMQRLGVIAQYECGVIYRVECWIDSLGIKYSVNPQTKKCSMLVDGTCSGDFRFDLK